jgi:SNF2 family DNA or RNA helicase
VQIYKLTIADTVEQRILELQEKKRAEARAVLAGDKIKGNKLNMNELMALFKSGGGANDDDDDDD